MTRWILDIETCGLNAISDRIVCITLKNYDSISFFCFIDEDEKKTLTNALSLIKENDTIVGYNSDTFDIPFLIKRALINDIKLPDFTKIKLIDLRKIANSWDLHNNIYEKGTLRDWANIMNFKYKTANGSDMPTMWANKEFAKIEAHNIEDVQLTELLLKKIEGCNLLKWED